MKKLLKTIIICYQIFNHLDAFSILPKGRALHFARFGGTCRGKNLPISINYTIREAGNRVFDINATLKATEDIHIRDLIVNVKVARCRSKENLDSCEDFLNNDRDYCALIDPRNKHKSLMFLNFTPEYKCPIKKGYYKAYNTKLDATAAAAFPLDGWYWRATKAVLDKKTRRLLSCGHFEAYVA